MTKREEIKGQTSEVSKGDLIEDSGKMEEIPTLESVLASDGIPDFVMKEAAFPTIKDLDSKIEKKSSLSIDFSALAMNLIPRELFSKEDDNIWTVNSLTQDISRAMSK